MYISQHSNANDIQMTVQQSTCRLISDFIRQMRIQCKPVITASNKCHQKTDKLTNKCTIIHQHVLPGIHHHSYAVINFTVIRVM